MRLTRLGLREIFLATLLDAVAFAVLVWLAMTAWPGCWILAGLVALSWLWVLWFFRDPSRRPPAGEGKFVSPADGRVSDITSVGAESALGCEGVRIGVFMNIFDVHVNRAPCDATVVDVTHRPGVFLDARRPEASERNESVTLRLRYTRGERTVPIVVRQIAGLIARRIVTPLTAGQAVSRGGRIGMIKWGSRLELLLPSDLPGEVCVRLGQRVRAGETVLFTEEVSHVE